MIDTEIKSGVKTIGTKVKDITETQIVLNHAEMIMTKSKQAAYIGSFIGWIGIIVTTIIMLMIGCQTATAQTMYEVKYESQADIKLYEVDYPAQADIKYFIVQYKSQANEQRHHWYWCQYPSQAKYRVYWVKYRSQADKLVYKVKYPSQTL